MSPHRGHIGTSMTTFTIPKGKRAPAKKPCLACGRLADPRKMAKGKAANGDTIYRHHQCPKR